VDPNDFESVNRSEAGNILDGVNGFVGSNVCVTSKTVDCVNSFVAMNLNEELIVALAPNDFESVNGSEAANLSDGVNVAVRSNDSE
jgi:hypothetical protein